MITVHITLYTLRHARQGEFVLTHPNFLMTYLSIVPKEHRHVFVTELCKYYATISAQSGTPMAPLNVPAWLT
jgi:hypothetical protein